MGGEAAFIQGDVLDGIGVEGREEAKHVVHVVYGHAVEQHQVLVGTAATHVESCRALRAALHTGEQLQYLQHIGLAKHCRHGLDLCHGDVHGTHLRASHAQVQAITHDGHLLQLGVCPHGNIHHRVGRELKGECLWRIAHIRSRQLHLTLGQSERVEPVGIGHRTASAHVVIHRSPYHCLLGRCVPHIAADGIALCVDRHSHQQ